MSKGKLLVLILPLLCLPLAAQDAKVAVAVPVTLSADGLFTNRIQTFVPGASNRAGAFRAMFYPTVKLGSRWFFYSAVQVSRTPYFYYDAYYPTREVNVDLLQGYLGYTRNSEKKAFTVKVGKLPSALGSFPLRYDETANPLLDSPLSYGSYLGLRGDQLPCGVSDLLRQRSYKFIRFSCGGSTDVEYGMWPVTLYGLAGAEADISFHSFDARFQVTNSAPSYPQGIFSDSQHVEWTAGAGYTIWQGFRVGASGFRGPFMEHELSDLLPAGKSERDYPETVAGFDVQWARGRLSAQGELQWFQFDYPGFRVSPAFTSGYAEAKVVLTPRVYAAARAGRQSYNHVEDQQARSSIPFQPEQQAYEFALGFHVDHFQTVKLGYEWVRTSGFSGSHDNVLGLQFVTSIDSLSKVLK